MFHFIRIEFICFIDSTTGTNETDANTVEMFTPPPPYPDELNYQLDLSPNLYEVCCFLDYFSIYKF